MPVEGQEAVGLSEEKSSDEVVPVVVPEPLHHPAHSRPVSQISGANVEGSKDSTGEEGVQFQDVRRLQAVSVSAEYLCGHHQVEERGGSLAQSDGNVSQAVVLSLRDLSSVIHI